MQGGFGASSDAPFFFAAGPPQGKKAPSGGSKPAQRAQRGGLFPSRQRPGACPRRDRHLESARAVDGCQSPCGDRPPAHRDRTGRADGSGAGRAHFMLMSDASFPAWRASWPWFWPVSGLVSACCWRR
ncbi:hypothetical protein C5E96_09860 [Bordetella pertussis]|nr:hypothetical protein CXD88_09590 [Bordetella pertussis]PNO97945.1 hypothetical protein AL465_002790 [Bordetella pertussis 18323]AZX07434.1 hypothetical protein CXD80_09560 [Bordetella pertussis]AZX11028.1 hypothetical protein CXD78_09575 [Bordetella pertussis]AZX21814.1 hypothetical protein CXD76_09570 [Bordetella pertussis]